MFTSIAKAGRSYLKELISERATSHTEEDPHADAFFTLVDGKPYTYAEFNALVAQQMAELNANDPLRSGEHQTKLDLPLWPVTAKE